MGCGVFRLAAGYEELSKFQHDNQHSRFEKDSNPGLWVEIKKRHCQNKASIGFFKNKISKYVYFNSINMVSQQSQHLLLNCLENIHLLLD